MSATLSVPPQIKIQMGEHKLTTIGKKEECEHGTRMNGSWYLCSGLITFIRPVAQWWELHLQCRETTCIAGDVG